MEAITFRYSAFKAIFVILLNLLFIGIAVFGIISTKGEDRMGMVAVSLALVGVLLYACNLLLLPALRNEAILEIDSEKLQYTLKGLTLYWKDIDDLDYEDFQYRNRGWQTFKVRFTMKNSGDEIWMSTWFIAGDNGEIFDAILTTFLKYRNNAS